MFFLPVRLSGGLWAVLGGCMNWSWWLCGLCLVGRVDCIGWLFGLCFVAVWVVLCGCLGYALWLFGLCLSAVHIASEGRLYRFLWLPVLYSVVAQAASSQPWQCVSGICERAPAALFAATGALPCCTLGMSII